MLEKLNDVAFSNDNIDCDDIDFDIVTFFNDDVGRNAIDLNNINLDDDNFNDDVPTNIVLIRLMACCNRFKQQKACKKR